MKKIWVKPRKKVLDGKGTLWELQLELAGYNDLKKEDQRGYITHAFEGDLVKIFFPALKTETMLVYTDEIFLCAV